MTTSIDTSIIVSLGSHKTELNSPASNALESVAAGGGLVISAPVFAELIAAPGFNEESIAEFCAGAGIVIELEMAETVWREAGRSFQAYAKRRRHSGDHHPRCILADFLIGAHALVNGYALLTMDKSIYRAAFPALKLLTC